MKHHKHFVKLISIFGIVLSMLLSSCEKEIQLDLREGDLKYVLEAYLDDSLGFRTKITQTKAFYTDNNFPAIEDAVVVLRDEFGNSHQILHDSAGWYIDTSLIGIPSVTYTLSISHSGKTFEASAKIPTPVPIDTIRIQTFNFGDSPDGVLRVMQLWYNDPAAEQNYYQGVVRFNDSEPSPGNFTGFIQDDRFNNGTNTFLYLFAGPGSVEIFPGDTATIILQSIEKATYDYLFTMEAMDGGPGGGIAPTNPPTNWSNGALGLFSVFSSKSITYIVRD